MSEVCGDNRFELIEEFKGKLIEGTNIETSPGEMAVLDNILFRIWQMGWLDKLKAREPVVHGRWIFHEENGPMDIWLTCSACGKESGVHKGNYYCHWCGAKMDSERRDSK